MNLRIYAIIIAFLSLLTACDKDNNNNNGNGGSSGTGVITADIDGQRWVAETGYTQQIQPFGMELVGMHNSDQLTITLSPYNGVQTYYLDGNTKITFLEENIEYRSIRGEVNVTSVTDETISGNFNCDVVSSVSSVTLYFTNGTFSIQR